VNYKELFNRITILISSPAKAWEEIGLEEDRHKAVDSFVYPMIGLCALSVFLGTLFYGEWNVDVLQVALRNSCVEAAALFVGCLVAALGIDFARVKVQHEESDMGLAKQFAGYAMVVVFIIHVVNGILPELTLIGWMLQFYIVYVVWEGVSVMMHVDEPLRLRLTIGYSLLLLVCPIVVKMLLNYIIPDLN
jgi:hypothetical protein